MVWASLVQMELIKEEITEREAGPRGWKRKEGRFCFFFITVAVCPKSAGVIVNVQSRPITTTLLLQTAHGLNTVWGGNKCMLALIRTWWQNKEFIRDVRVWTHAFNQTSEQLPPPPLRTALLHSSRRGRLIWSLQFVSLTGCQASVCFHFVVLTKTNRNFFFMIKNPACKCQSLHFLQCPLGWLQDWVGPHRPRASPTLVRIKCTSLSNF